MPTCAAHTKYASTNSTTESQTLYCQLEIRTIAPATQQVTGGGGSFFFDYAAFAAGSSITIEMVGKAKTVTCSVDAANLSRMR